MIYFDNSATTFVDPKVLETLIKYVLNIQETLILFIVLELNLRS